MAVEFEGQTARVARGKVGVKGGAIGGLQSDQWLSARAVQFGEDVSMVYVFEVRPVPKNFKARPELLSLRQLRVHTQYKCLACLPNFFSSQRVTTILVI